MASIKIIQGPDKGKVFQLQDGENILGRQEGGLELGDGTVSRRHVMLSRRGEKWLLTDLGSANGTYLNGVRVTKAATLNRGDQIRCGGTLLVFAGGQPTATMEASVDIDEDGKLLDAAIVATMPSNEDSVIIPTPEAGAQAIDNLRFIYGLIAELGSIFDSDKLLERTLAKIFEILPADRGYTMLIDENDKLQLKAFRYAPNGVEHNPPISRTIINEVLSKQVGVLSTNAMSDKRFASGKSVHKYGIRSAICVPIKGQDKILGIIHLDCSISDHTYSTEQLRLLTAIGYQAGLAIDNVRLHISAVQSERLAAVGETVASLSHHIKNILQGLGAGIDVVKMSIDAGDLAKAKNSWPVVERNLARINETILNMLAFSKDREPLLESTDINEMLKDCVELVTSQGDERGVAIMPDLEDVPKIPADVDGLHQAILNLLNNALDAVGDQTGVVTVSSRHDTMNRNVLISVADNGSGMSDNQLGQIFNPFYSGKGQKGTGLGLAVAKKIVSEHHGQINVKSQVGEGTTFTIALPIIPPAETPADVDAAAGAAVPGR
ncbi:MAG: GAF domain-containing protein [Phycisphaerae bacterium]|nr:GAF domain-containing protein [Phycisphaerae bacterium]